MLSIPRYRNYRPIPSTEALYYSEHYITVSINCVLRHYITVSINYVLRHYITVSINYVLRHYITVSINCVLRHYITVSINCGHTHCLTVLTVLCYSKYELCTEALYLQWVLTIYGDTISLTINCVLRHQFTVNIILCTKTLYCSEYCLCSEAPYCSINCLMKHYSIQLSFLAAILNFCVKCPKAFTLDTV